MTRGHDRTSHRSRDRSPAQDHEATSAKNDLPTVDPGNENRKRMAGKRAVSGGFFAKRDGMIPIRKTAEAGALDATPLLPYREKSKKGFQCGQIANYGIRFLHDPADGFVQQLEVIDIHSAVAVDVHSAPEAAAISPHCRRTTTQSC